MKSKEPIIAEISEQMKESMFYDACVKILESEGIDFFKKIGIYETAKQDFIKDTREDGEE